MRWTPHQKDRGLKGRGSPRQPPGPPPTRPSPLQQLINPPLPLRHSRPPPSLELRRHSQTNSSREPPRRRPQRRSERRRRRPPWPPTWPPTGRTKTSGPAADQMTLVNSAVFQALTTLICLLSILQQKISEKTPLKPGF